MIVSYALRLFCLCLAVSTLVHTAIGTAVALLEPALVRAAESLRPRRGARLLLAARLLPAAAAIFVVAVFCIPSYLWLETETAGEEVGAAFLAAAALGVALWGMGLLRAARALARSVRYSRLCRRAGCETSLPGEVAAVTAIETAQPVVALIGILRPKLVISRSVIDALSPEQLRVVLDHEHAHRRAHDNLKRLLVAAAPGLLPRLHKFAALERAWRRMAEWAADDESAADDALRSTALAAALVRVARLGAPPRLNQVTASFCGDADELAGRVERLLHPPVLAPERPPQTWILTAAASVTVAASLAGVLLTPESLASAHQLFERVVH